MAAGIIVRLRFKRSLFYDNTLLVAAILVSVTTDIVEI